MSSRIRYKFNKITNSFQSDTFVANGGKLVVVVLDINKDANSSFKIVDCSTHEVLATGSNKSSANVKKRIKKTLEDMGVPFERELRMRGNLSLTEQVQKAYGNE